MIGEKPEKIASNVQKLIQLFYAGNPSVTILLSKILPSKVCPPHCKIPRTKGTPHRAGTLGRLLAAGPRPPWSG